MKGISLFAVAIACFTTLSAQHSYPRLFLDLPAIYLTAPDVEHISNVAGAGLETALNFGTHWSTVRLGGGSTVTLDPQSKELSESVLFTPYGQFLIGLGKYRTNGDQCASHHRKAFTAMLTGGLRYNFDTRKEKIEAENDGYGLDYTVGAEFGYFYIRDVFKNSEFFLNGNYHVKAEAISASIGFKMFLNLRANRD